MSHKKSTLKKLTPIEMFTTKIRHTKKHTWKKVRLSMIGNDAWGTYLPSKIAGETIWKTTYLLNNSYVYDYHAIFVLHIQLIMLDLILHA